MDNTKLIEYIKTENIRGTKHEEIYNRALLAGWPKESIYQSFISVFGNKPSAWSFMLSDINDLIEDTIKFYTVHFKLIIKISSLPYILIILFWILEIIIFPGVLPKNIPVFYRIPTNLIIKFFQLFTMSSLFYALVHIDNNLTYKTIIRAGLSNLIKFFWTSAIMTIICIAGTLFFIIPGIIFTNWFIFSPILVFSENLSGFNALKRSHYYTKGYWWKIFWRMFAIEISVGLLIIGLSFLGYFGGLMKFDTPISAVIGTLLMPIPIIFLYLLYIRIKKIKLITADTKS